MPLLDNGNRYGGVRVMVCEIALAAHIPLSVTIASSVLHAFSEDPELRAIFGKDIRVYETQPSEPEYPYMTVNRTTKGPAHEIKYHIWHKAERDDLSAERNAVHLSMDAVTRVLDGIDFPLPDAHILCSRVSYRDVFQAPGRRLFHGILVFKLSTVPR